MNISCIEVGMLGACCYILQQNGEALVIDPGDEDDRIMATIGDDALTAILLTHGHYDHIRGLSQVVGSASAPVYIHSDDQEMLSDTNLNLGGMLGHDYVFDGESSTFETDDTLNIGSFSVKTIGVPGHTPGGSCFYFEQDHFLFSGDTLFNSGIGRSDFPGGDGETLTSSIREKLFSLPATTQVYPGHGPATTIGTEEKNNPFF